MRFQELPYSCGAASVVNVARCFGRRISERSARAAGGTTPDGTSEHGILRALAEAGLRGTPFGSADFRLALATLADTPAIISTQLAQHWEAVIGRTDGGRRWIVVNGANTKANLRENGVAILDRRALRRLWRNRDGVFYAILVNRV